MTAQRPYRIGHLYPSGGTSEHELYRMAPEHVRFLTTRMTFRHAAMNDCVHLLDGLESHLELLSDARVDLIAVNCTTATMLAGANEINQRVAMACGIPSVTTIEAVLEALGACALKRIALLTPYQKEVVQSEVDFFAQHGIRVVATAGRPVIDPVQQGEVPPEFWLDQGLRLMQSDCDGLLISCAGIQVAPILARLELECGRPVVASNQALVWHCLKRLGIEHRDTRFGSLMQR